jgi:hypothetical protein
LYVVVKKKVVSREKLHSKSHNRFDLDGRCKKIWLEHGYNRSCTSPLDQNKRSFVRLKKEIVHQERVHTLCKGIDKMNLNPRKYSISKKKLSRSKSEYITVLKKKTCRQLSHNCNT